MISVATTMTLILLISADSVLCNTNDNTLVDQVAEKSHAKDIRSDVNSNDLVNKYGDIITNNSYIQLQYNVVYSNDSASTNLFNSTVDNKYKLFNFTNSTGHLTDAAFQKKNKFVFPKLRPLPDLTGWITVIPLESNDEDGPKKHGLFRIGRYQNGQYYLNPIRRPGKNLYSSGGLTPLANIRKHLAPFYSSKNISPKKMNSSFSNSDQYQDRKGISYEHFIPVDNIATESRHEKVIVNTKIKHHHHHHHHKYLKTVLKKVPVKVPVKVYVDRPIVVKKKVPYPVKKIIKKVVYKKVPVYIEKKVKVPYPVKIKIPEPYPVKVFHKEYVAEPYPVIKNVPVIKEVKVPVHHHIHHTVEKPVPYPVKVPVKINVPYPVEVEKKILYPVKVFVDKPYPVEKIVPQTIIKQVPVPVYVEKAPTIHEEHFIHYPLEKASVEVESTPLPLAPLIPVRVYVPNNNIEHDHFSHRKSSGNPFTPTVNNNQSSFLINVQ